VWLASGLNATDSIHILRSRSYGDEMNGPPRRIRFSPKDLAQGLCNGAEEANWCSILDEPHLLSLWKGRMLQMN
jgi:hypothetical protein